MPLRSNPPLIAVPDCVSDLPLARQPGAGRGLPAHLAFLRERTGPGPVYAGALPFGDARVDGCFPPHMGGLPLGALHEIGAEGRGAETGELPAAFAATLIAGICGNPRGRGQGQAPVLWVATVPDLYPPGLPGLDPARLVLVNPRDEAGVLAALEIALRAGGFAAVVGEVGAMDRVASRRLAFACQKHGVTAFVLRRWPHGNRVPDRQASAAATRWVLAPAPRPHLNPYGRWQVTLTHVRGGRGGSWLMEGINDTDRARADGKTVPVRVVAALADHAVAAAPNSGQAIGYG